MVYILFTNLSIVMCYVFCCDIIKAPNFFITKSGLTRLVEFDKLVYSNSL